MDVYERELEQNQRYVQPKAYLSTLINFHTFNLYPDVYALLLNDVHRNLNPVTKRGTQEVYMRKFDVLLKKIPGKFMIEIGKITKQMAVEKIKIDGNRIPSNVSRNSNK